MLVLLLKVKHLDNLKGMCLVNQSELQMAKLLVISWVLLSVLLLVISWREDMSTLSELAMAMQ